MKIDSEQIRDVLIAEVIKREVVEGDKADEARKKITRAVNKALRKSEKESDDVKTDVAPD